MVFTEIPTNPWLRVIDLEALVGISQRYGLRVITDSTLATPCNLRPLALGADLVIHSGTKYLGGHHDLLAGVILGAEGLVNEVRELHFNLGGVVAPQTAYNLLRGLKTLELRVRHHNAAGMAVALLVLWGLNKVFAAVQSSSEVKVAGLIGTTAEVISPIPEGGVGEIAYVAEGTRLSAPARTPDGRPVARGTRVKIVRIAGSEYFVKPRR